MINHNTKDKIVCQNNERNLWDTLEQLDQNILQKNKRWQPSGSA